MTDWPHNASTYVNHKCRCALCKADHTRRAAEMRAERYAITRWYGLPPDVEHGNSAYTNWGCRCEICTTAHPRNNNASARQPARRKTKANERNQA